MFFFFSSRRRHTRWTGDWSSDVCSSDLEPRTAGNADPRRWLSRMSGAAWRADALDVRAADPATSPRYLRRHARERRVAAAAPGHLRRIDPRPRPRLLARGRPR